MPTGREAKEWEQWFAKYDQAVREEGQDADERAKAMKLANPKYIMRNWMMTVRSMPMPAMMPHCAPHDGECACDCACHDFRTEGWINSKAATQVLQTLNFQRVFKSGPSTVSVA